MRDLQFGWFYVPTPMLDEPVMAVRRSGDQLTTAALLYLVSDGTGQLLAAGDTAGVFSSPLADPKSYVPGTWVTAGLTTRAQTFMPGRDPSQGMSQDSTISTFRTRQYDPATGSWLQEDHAGIAGGINLYQYNGNDPNTFGNPFGTCPNPPCVSPDDPFHGQGLPDDVHPEDLTWRPDLGSHGGYEHDKSGKLYIPDTEDRYHWRHWDVVTPSRPGQGHTQQRYPKDSFKPGYGPAGEQSVLDPFGSRFSDLGEALVKGMDWLGRILKKAGPPFAVPHIPGFPALPIPIPLP